MALLCMYDGGSIGCARGDIPFRENLQALVGMVAAATLMQLAKSYIKCVNDMMVVIQVGMMRAPSVTSCHQVLERCIVFWSDDPVPSHLEVIVK